MQKTSIKEFFKIDAYKIIITSVIAAALTLLLLYNIGVDCEDYAPTVCHTIAWADVITIPLWWAPVFFFRLPSIFGGQSAPYLSLFLVIIASILYWYFLACILVFIFRFLKKLKNKHKSKSH